MLSGQYYDLLERGFIRPEDYEPYVTGLEFYLDAFRELGTCRPGGMDLQAIPFTAIVEYSKIFDIGDLEDFLIIIRAMDDVYLREESERNKGTDAGEPASKNDKNKR